MTQRFRTLDAMRGVAAIVVVIYHMTALYRPIMPGGAHSDVPFGYLAVDMFFAISGFVLAKAYDHRLATGLSGLQFMVLRAKRLYPIYWLGTAIGLVPLAIDVLNGFPRSAAFFASASAGVMLPSSTASLRPELFPLNPPAWSLFLELFVANLLFGLFHRHLHGKLLLVLIAVGAVGMIATQVHFGTLDTGYTLANLAGGCPRVIFGFFVGVALFRWRDRLPMPRIPASVVLVILTASFFAPIPDAYAPVYQLGCALILYPVLICLGAGSVERRPRLGEILGDASYALYAVHYPLLLVLDRLRPIVAWTPDWSLAGAYLIGCLVLALVIERTYQPRAAALMAKLPRSQ